MVDDQQGDLEEASRDGRHLQEEVRRKHIVSNDTLSQGDHQARSKRPETHVKKKVDAPGRFSASKLGICNGLLSRGP